MKEVQWATPMVWAPDKATASVASKFLSARFVSSVPVGTNGDGRFASVAFLVANVTPSLRPSGTLYCGPPVCLYNKFVKTFKQMNEVIGLSINNVIFEVCCCCC